MSGYFRPPTDAERCIATVTKGLNKGKRCPRYHIRGATVCTSHGGKAPQVKAAAARRVADQKALELASRMQVSVPRLQTPGEAAQYTLSQVQRRAAQFAQAADQLTSATYMDRAGQERVRAVLAEERRWLDSMVKLLGVAVVAGSAGTSEPTGPSPVEVFKMTCNLFTEDIDAALCDVGVFDAQQRAAIMTRLAARTSLRVRQSAGMIAEQINIMSEAAR